MISRNFNDHQDIRRTINKIVKEAISEDKVFSSVKRLLQNRTPVTSATIRTRGGESTPLPKQNKVQHAAIKSLTGMVGSRYDRSELADHINFLLKNHFSNEDGAVIKKLQELSDQLVKDTKKSARDADAALADQGGKLAPPDFKILVRDLEESLSGEFDLGKDQLKVQYYVAVDHSGTTDPQDHVFHLAYLSIPSLKTNDNIKDVLVVVTRRLNPGGGSDQFVRTFTNYVNPAALLKTNIGIRFDNTARCLDIIMTSLRLDKVIDVAHPSQIPVKEADLKFTNKNIINQKIDVQNGVVSIYLAPAIKDQKSAETVLQEVFVEAKNLIRSVHPRNRNPLRASVPKLVTVKVGGKQEKVYSFRLSFSKPENAKSPELPRNKVKQFLDILDIQNPKAAQDFNQVLKRFVGIGE